MQDVLVPAPLNHLRNKNRDAASGKFSLQLADQFEDRLMHRAILRVQHDEARREQTRCDRGSFDIVAPLLAQPALLLIPVGPAQLREMHGHDVLRDAERKPERIVAELVPALERDEHDGGLDPAQIERRGVAHVRIKLLVIASNSFQQQDHAGDDHDRDPGAFDEFCNNDDDQRNCRHGRAERVDAEVHAQSSGSCR